MGHHGKKHIQEKLLDQARNQWDSIVSHGINLLVSRKRDNPREVGKDLFQDSVLFHSYVLTRNLTTFLLQFIISAKNKQINHCDLNVALQLFISNTELVQS